MRYTYQATVELLRSGGGTLGVFVWVHSYEKGGIGFGGNG